MIEFALLFGLGFLTAALLVLLLTPAVYRRVVWFTESRLRATTPLSPQEVRAQKDMARAVYAAENAKAAQNLVREREKGVTLQLNNEALLKEAGRLQTENTELRMQIDDMSVEAADMRSQLGREDSYSFQLKGKLESAEHSRTAKEAEMQALLQRVNRMVTDVDDLKIELAARDTQVESLKFRIKTLRDERDALRQDLKLVTQRAKDAEIRLDQEEHKSLRLEERLTREQASNADKDKENIIERRVIEINRLPEKLKTTNAETRSSAHALRSAGNAKPVAAAKPADGGEAAAKPDLLLATLQDGPFAHAQPEEIRKCAEDVRNQGTAFAERLMRAGTSANDVALREEIGAVATKMVVLTVMREGPQSPVLTILSESAASTDDGPASLAGRIIKAIEAVPTETPAE